MEGFTHRAMHALHHTSAVLRPRPRPTHRTHSRTHVLVPHLLVPQVVAGSAAVLESLRLHSCTLLTNTALLCLSRQCPRLRELDLTGVELLTDSAVLELAQATLGLHP